MLRIILIFLLIYFLVSFFKNDVETEKSASKREERLIEIIDPNYDKKVGR